MGDMSATDGGGKVEGSMGGGETEAAGGSSNAEWSSKEDDAATQSLSDAGQDGTSGAGKPKDDEFTKMIQDILGGSGAGGGGKSANASL